jgi:hypothetical protein
MVEGEGADATSEPEEAIPPAGGVAGGGGDDSLVEGSGGATDLEQHPRARSPRQGGGESIVRVHWVAVPKTLRARRVNRRRRRWLRQHLQPAAAAAAARPQRQQQQPRGWFGARRQRAFCVWVWTGGCEWAVLRAHRQLIATSGGRTGRLGAADYAGGRHRSRCGEAHLRAAAAAAGQWWRREAAGIGCNGWQQQPLGQRQRPEAQPAQSDPSLSVGRRVTGAPHT